MQKEKTLARLSRLRQMEEEMSRLDLEAAVAERERLFRSWQAASNARGAGRRSFSESVEEGDGAARQSSLLTMEQSRRRQESFAAMLNAADRAIEQLRTNFLARRTATRQAETLMQEARAERHADDARRVQQMLDDWFGHRNRLASASSARQERRRDAHPRRSEGTEEQSKG